MESPTNKSEPGFFYLSCLWMIHFPPAAPSYVWKLHCYNPAGLSRASSKFVCRWFLFYCMHSLSERDSVIHQLFHTLSVSHHSQAKHLTHSHPTFQRAGLLFQLMLNCGSRQCLKNEVQGPETAVFIVSLVSSIHNSVHSSWLIICWVKCHKVVEIDFMNVGTHIHPHLRGWL